MSGNSQKNQKNTQNKKNVQAPQNLAKQKNDNTLNAKNRIYSYWAELFTLNLLAIAPLYLHPSEFIGRYFDLTRHKAYYLWISSFILFALMGLVWLSFMGVAKSKSERKLSDIKLPDWAAAAYLLTVVLSAVFSNMPEYFNGGSNFSHFMIGAYERHDGIITIAIYVFAYFAISRLFRHKERDWVIFGISAIAVSFIGIMQGIGFDIFNLYPYGKSSQTVGVYPYNYLDIIFRSTLGNVDIVSPYVCIAIGFFLAMYMRSDKKLRFLYLAAEVLTFTMMVISGADGGKVGVVAAIALLLILNITDKLAVSRMFFALSLSSLLTTIHTAAFAARDFYAATGDLRTFYWGDWYKGIWFLAALGLFALALIVRFIPVWIKGTPWKAALISLICVLVIGLAGVEVVGSRIENTENIIYQARETMHLRLGDTFGSFRGFLWKNAIQVVPENLIFGTGPDTFKYAFRDYQELSAFVTFTHFDKAHNDYLQILICNGLLGLAAFMAFIVSLAVKAIPKVWGDAAVMACVAACAAYMVQAFFGISTPMVTPLFFALLGILRGLVYVRRD